MHFAGRIRPLIDGVCELCYFGMPNKRLENRRYLKQQMRQVTTDFVFGSEITDITKIVKWKNSGIIERSMFQRDRTSQSSDMKKKSRLSIVTLYLLMVARLQAVNFRGYRLVLYIIYY